MSNLKKMDDEALNQVSGGYMEVDVYDPKKHQVNSEFAIKDANTAVVYSKLNAGEAQATGSKNDPLKRPPQQKPTPTDPFGTNLNAGSGLA